MGIAKAKIDIRLAEAKVRSIDQKFYKQQKKQQNISKPSERSEFGKRVPREFLWILGLFYFLLFKIFN